LIEIVDARRIPSTPIMEIYLTKKIRKNRAPAVKIARDMVHTTIEHIAQTIYFDTVNDEIVVELNQTMIEDRGLSLQEIINNLQIPNCSIKIVDNHLHITPEKIKDITKLLDKVSSARIKGVSGITRVLITEERGEWVIRTDGSNLSSILEIDGVDKTRTITNNVHEVRKTLGIEAARNLLIKEAKNVLDEQGLDVDIRHVMLVSDIMTSTGETQQIGRHGISGKKSSVLARAAFEITVPNIVNAAMKGDSDPLSGVTENVIVGQSIPIGTGLVELYMSTFGFEREEK
jgi:DNA-directed RNA polymerase subunit A"